MKFVPFCVVSSLAESPALNSCRFKNGLGNISKDLKLEVTSIK